MTAEGRIAALRRIVDQHQHAMVDGYDMDAFSASAYLQIHDRLSERNQANLNGRKLNSAMAVVWAVIEKVNS
jgi:hypothetical protein